MCIITDANVLGDLNRKTDDAIPILRWLLTDKGGLIIGGYLKTELERSTKFRVTLVELSRAGRLHKLDDGRVSTVAARIASECCSDDCHVVAAAIISGCRLVFTRDQELHKDLKNTRLVEPPAAIYQDKSHRHLLTQCDCKD